MLPPINISLTLYTREEPPQNQNKMLFFYRGCDRDDAL